MACIYKQTKLIKPHDPYLLIAPHAHPNNCGRVKRKATQKRPFAYLVGNMAHAKNSLKRPPRVTMGTIPNLEKSKKQAKR